MLLTKKALIRWNPRIKKWYVDKGYIYTKMQDEFEVKIEDLSDGSNASVEVECDNCGEILLMRWCDYNKSVRNNYKYYCQKCALKLFGTEKSIKTKLEKSISFEKWCCDNLSKENADKILLRWDYDLNIKNGKVLSPKDVSRASRGINNKGFWFKCLEHPEHKSELKRINHYTSGSNIHMGRINCNQCNVVSLTNPELVKYLVNKEDALKYSFGSNENILMRCPDCGYEKEINIYYLRIKGFGCPKCSDGISYPEKFMINLLEQLSLNFKFQLSKTIFDWCNGYKYDLYLDTINCIIETHGIQHYEENHFRDLLNKTQENDRDKKQLASNNGINNYIVLDCRRSTIEWIKNSVMNSGLPQLLNFKEADIDWIICHKSACLTIIKKACDLWNNGVKDTFKISTILKHSRGTVIRYLHQGAELGWCDYISKEEQKKYYNSISKILGVRVICLTTGEVFDSQREASRKYNIKCSSSISGCCNGRKEYAGRHPETGERLVWALYSK